MPSEECTDPTAYELEDCCTPPLITGGDTGGGVEGPPGPVGPPGPPGTGGEAIFPFVFVFGDGINAPQAGSKITLPVPEDGTFVYWQARVVGDVTGNAEFALRHAITPTGALSSVGGTQPELVGVKGDRQTTVDWGTQTVVQGGILECEYVSGDVLGVTLTVEYNG